LNLDENLILRVQSGLEEDLTRDCVDQSRVKTEGDASKNKDPDLMKEAFAKLSGDEIAVFMRAFSAASSVNAPKPAPALAPAPRVELPPIDVKLDGPASYLSWSRRVRYTLVGRRLEGYLTGAITEPDEGTPAWEEWRSTHMLVYELNDSADRSQCR
jgi:hypothetical protein